MEEYDSKDLIRHEVSELVWNLSLNLFPEPFVIGEILRELAKEFDDADKEMVESGGQNEE